MATRSDVEEATLRAFVRRERGDRYGALLGSRKKREKLLRELDHFYNFDGRFARDLERDEDAPAALYALLRELGAPDTCYLSFSSRKYDGTTPGPNE